MAVRTYNPSVRVGNWSEDIQLEEDTLKDFLEKREKGELLMQKNKGLETKAEQKVNISISRDGKVHFGDVVMIMNAPRDEIEEKRTVCLNMKFDGVDGVVASAATEPSARNAFVVESIDGSPNGSTLKYGQKFLLRTVMDCHYLMSDRVMFNQCAKKSRHQIVNIVNPEVAKETPLVQWKIVPFDPQFRLELDYCDVPANERFLITHVTTNHNLNVEPFILRTYFGQDRELTCHTQTDSHKAEVGSNHWMLVMSVPGDTLRGVDRPEGEGNPPPCGGPPQVC